MTPLPVTSGGGLDDSNPTARLTYLHPGQLVAFAEPMVVTTVLGSCVSVGLYDESAGVGGLNHFVLSEAFGVDVRSPRYAGPACELLLDRVLALGARAGRLRAKLFGGATAFSVGPGRTSVGANNVAAARAWLAAQRIETVAADTGGALGRRLYFELPGGASRVLTLGGGPR